MVVKGVLGGVSLLFVAVSVPVDDGLLSEIELVMEVRSASAIRALDEFTFASR